MRRDAPRTRRRVTLAPIEAPRRSRWERFKAWLREKFKRANRDLDEDANTIVSHAVEAGQAVVQRPALANDLMRAQIELQRACVREKNAKAESVELRNLDHKLDLWERLRELKIAVSLEEDEPGHTTLRIDKRPEFTVSQDETTPDDVGEHVIEVDVEHDE